MVSKTKRRQSKRLNRNISFGSDLEENGEITPSNRTRENQGLQENVPSGTEIQAMIENAVAKALSNCGVNKNNQLKRPLSTQVNGNTNKDGDNTNIRVNCNSDQYHNRSRDGNCADSSNLIGRPAANYHNMNIVLIE